VRVKIATPPWKTFLAGVYSIGLAVTASPADAQTFLLDPVDETTFTLQLEKPFFPSSDGLAFYSSILEPDVVLSLSSGKTLQIGVPLAIAGADFADGTSLYLGNLRASLVFGEPGHLSGFLGLTFPTASNISGPDLAVLVGALPWLNELEKWGEDGLSVRGAWIPSRPLDSGGRLGLRLGGAAVTPNDFENLYVYARIAGWGQFPVGSAALRADLGTSYNVTSDDGFGQQFTAYLDLGVELPESSRQPMIFLRLPLDGEARQVLDFSLGWRMRF
jgi:hypothetical protein